METTKKIKTLTGIVSSKSGIKSIRVTIDYKVKHPKYGKYIRRRTKLAVHDELNRVRGRGHRGDHGVAAVQQDQELARGPSAAEGRPGVVSRYEMQRL